MVFFLALAAASAAAHRAGDAGGEDCNADSGQGPASYRIAEITSPQNDMAVRDNAGHVLVQAQIQPDLHCAHRVQLLLDGLPAQQEVGEVGGLEFLLVNIDRGTHQLQLRIVDADATVLFTGQPSTFHLLRHSRLHPQPRLPTSPH